MSTPESVAPDILHAPPADTVEAAARSSNDPVAEGPAGDPFIAFVEWDGSADDTAYADL